LKSSIYIVLIWAGISSCRREVEIPTYTYEFDIPAHFPAMEIPEDNPITPEKIQLGKLFFEDVRLSRNNTISCASCHHQQLAFSDTGRLSVGLYGEHPKRNSPPLFNLGYHPYYFKDGGAPTLEIQVISPVENPVEMDMTIVEVCQKLKDDENYKLLSNKIFGTEVTPFVVSRSLATYLRSLISGGSKFDEYLKGNEQALNDEEKLGYQIFQGKANCIVCHSGHDFTNYTFQNNGIYETYTDTGRAVITGLPEDVGKFKVASLRNLSFTGPYMFDGSIATIDDVIEHYNNGGSNHINKSTQVFPLNLSHMEKEALKAFLFSLNDYKFVEQ
jgi:cytochrome c peroxidase